MLKRHYAALMTILTLIMGCKDQTEVQLYVMYPPYTIRPDEITMRMGEYFVFHPDGLPVPPLDSAGVHGAGAVFELDPSQVGFEIKPCSTDCDSYVAQGWMLVDQEFVYNAPEWTCQGLNCVKITTIGYHIHENLEFVTIPTTAGDFYGYRPIECGPTWAGESLKESSGGVVWPVHDAFNDTVWIEVLCE